MGPPFWACALLFGTELDDDADAACQGQQNDEDRISCQARAPSLLWPWNVHLGHVIEHDRIPFPFLILQL